MKKSYDLGSGRVVQLEEATAHHWIGTCDSLVILVLREGSHDDPQHIVSTERAVSRLLQQSTSPVNAMVIFSPTLSKPPSVAVRDAIVAASPAFTKLARAAGVVTGQGFLAAIHRGAMTGVLSMMRIPAAVRVVASVGDALEHLYGPQAPSWAPLVKFCDERVANAD